MFKLNENILRNLSYKNHFCQVLVNHYHKNIKLDIKLCCDILDLDNEDFDINKLKNSYIKCCKKYHPDVNENKNDKFMQIEQAYQTLKEYLQNKESESDNRNLDEEEENRIKHIVPQHRQYLTYDGIGYGTPSSRLKQYQKHRLDTATQVVNEFQVEKVKRHSSQSNEIALRDVNLQRQIKPKQGFDRLVEDLIQEAISKGDFDNLPGRGKPLNYQPELPYVDCTTYKLNQILINNGFVPEWVKLEREIKQNKQEIRKELYLIIVNENGLKNNNKKQEIENKVKKLNMKIDKYNTLVPIINKQKIHFILKKEIAKIELEKQNLSKGNTYKSEHVINNNKNNYHNNNNGNDNRDKTFIDFFLDFLRF